MEKAYNPGDGKFVVIENGQRVTPALNSREEAEKEAKKRNQVAESSGSKPESAVAVVKQNIFG